MEQLDLDPVAILIAVAVIGVLGLFFWYVAYRFLSFGKRVGDLLDSSSERKRDRLAYEAKYGAPPARKQALRRLAEIVLVLAALGLVWLRLKGS